MDDSVVMKSLHTNIGIVRSGTVLQVGGDDFTVSEVYSYSDDSINVVVTDQSGDEFWLVYEPDTVPEFVWQWYDEATMLCSPATVALGPSFPI